MKIQTPTIAIMVLGSPYGSASNHTALEYAKAVIESRRSITRVFFYHEAVNVGTTLSESSQDEINLPEAWQNFLKSNGIEATVCISSSLKRGIIDANEASRYDKPAHNACDALALEGIGQWIDAVQSSDRHIVFGS